MHFFPNVFILSDQSDIYSARMNFGFVGCQVMILQNAVSEFIDVLLLNEKLVLKMFSFRQGFMGSVFINHFGE